MAVVTTSNGREELATEMAAVTTSNGREEVGDETRFDRVKRC